MRSVVVDGRFVLRDRAPCFDAASIFAEGRAQAARLWERMDHQGGI